MSAKSLTDRSETFPGRADASPPPPKNMSAGWAISSQPGIWGVAERCCRPVRCLLSEYFLPAIFLPSTETLAPETRLTSEAATVEAAPGASVFCFSTGRSDACARCASCAICPFFLFCPFFASVFWPSCVVSRAPVTAVCPLSGLFCVGCGVREGNRAPSPLPRCPAITASFLPSYQCLSYQCLSCRRHCHHRPYAMDVLYPWHS